jgi:hypothetical protein
MRWCGSRLAIGTMLTGDIQLPSSQQSGASLGTVPSGPQGRLWWAYKVVDNRTQRTKRDDTNGHANPACK